MPPLGPAPNVSPQDPKKPGSQPHVIEWLEFRDRARKDLYWLGHDLIASEQSGAGFVEHVHREMCAMFVPKNFDGVYHEGYTLDT